MDEGISNRLRSATAQREALERERDSADPDRRAEIEAQLINLRDMESMTRQQIEGLNGFTGVPTYADQAPELQAAKEKQQEQKQEPQTVFQKEVHSGPRFPGAAGYFGAERIVETHVHPDIIEARQANAQTQQVREQLATEQAEREAAKAREEEIRAKDQERAARVFEGGHAPEGFGTAEYLSVERMHRQSTLDYAQKAKANAEHEAAEQESIVELTDSTGIEHVIMEPDTSIEGEIAAEVEVKGAAYYTVEFTDPKGQSMRALIPATGQNYSVGDQIEVERSLGYHIDTSIDYGR